MPRRDVIDIAGQVFGDRTAVSYVGDKKWLARCRCGREFVVAGADLRRRAYRCTHVRGDLFWAKVEKTDKCWLWTAGLDADGYGAFRSDLPSNKAHIFAWREKNGPVPNGFELDHLCRNRACVRPDHLEPVTHAENVRRGQLGEVTRARHARAKEIA